MSTEPTRTIKIYEKTHPALRLLAAMTGETMMDLVDRLVQEERPRINARNQNREIIENQQCLRTDWIRDPADRFRASQTWYLASKLVDKRSGSRHYSIAYNRMGASYDSKSYPTVDALLDAMAELAPHEEWQFHDPSIHDARFDGDAFDE